jgi:uncharacterized membrane protein YsdA (DUF1294 family)
VREHWVNPHRFFLWWSLSVGAVGACIAFFALGLSAGATYLVGINLGACALIALDKWLAQGESLRAPERVFIVLACLGGGVGLLVGIQAFRHKTRKARLQALILLAVCVQVLVWSE